MSRRLLPEDTPSYHRNKVIEDAILRDERRRAFTILRDAVMPFFSTTFTPSTKE
jgi:hypothetical protein